MSSRTYPARSNTQSHNFDPSPGVDRAWALSQLVADEASRDDDVLRFRRQHLPSGLLPWSDLEGWINQHTPSVGTVYVTIALPPGAPTPIPATGGSAIPPDANVVRTEAKALAWARPTDRWTQRTPTQQNTPLAHLRGLSESLADQMAWQPAQAAIFVTTGTVPLIQQI